MEVFTLLFYDNVRPCPFQSNTAQKREFVKRVLKLNHNETKSISGIIINTNIDLMLFPGLLTVRW